MEDLSQGFYANFSTASYFWIGFVTGYFCAAIPMLAIIMVLAIRHLP
jgi:hypothetical protein